MFFLRAVDRFIEIVSKNSVHLSGASVVILLALGTIDRISTEIFSVSIPSAMELQEAFEVIVIFLALATVQNQRSHIVIELFTDRMQPRLRWVSEVFSLLATSGFYFLLTWQAFNLAYRSIRVREVSPGYFDFPIYPFKALFLFGCAMALLEALRQLTRQLVTLMPSTRSEFSHTD